MPLNTPSNPPSPMHSNTSTNPSSFQLTAGEYGISVQLLSETQSRLADMKRRMKSLRTKCNGLNLSFAPQVTIVTILCDLLITSSKVITYYTLS